MGQEGVIPPPPDVTPVPGLVVPVVYGNLSSARVGRMRRFKCDFRIMTHLVVRLLNSSLGKLETRGVKKLFNTEFAIGKSLLVGIFEQRL